MDYRHVSVMVNEVREILGPRDRRRYLDGTIGGGGHAEQLLIHSSPEGRVLGLDRDEEALDAARARLRQYGDRLVLRHANFVQAKGILDELGWGAVDGALLDLGVSAHQLESPDRGFSFQFDSRLDMRMDRRQALDAFAIVNRYPARELEDMLRTFGEEPQARRIAREIVAARARKPIETTGELAALVRRVKRRGQQGHHPATQTFQALRIAVNAELESLRVFLQHGYEILRPKARMAIISFHSLEDRLVKNAFRTWSRACLCPPGRLRCECGWSQKATLLTKKPLRPSAEEVEANPRARSAKLRAVERI
ncbi:MAG TPA: 16S rRNA (cytosine(1402)-N(4))-methyltransferase RsmH [Candidatus Eisenbacteria bacterium]|nr:16S rRNA (cytosine(1402)-N(4))-methyltransferase RsmH [Candidatus Eisenbacteria bacterium]